MATREWSPSHGSGNNSAVLKGETEKYAGGWRCLGVPDLSLGGVLSFLSFFLPCCLLPFLSEGAGAGAGAGVGGGG